MTQIATARGPVDASELGRTLVHEHVFVLDPEYQDNYPDTTEEELLAVAVKDLAELQSRGIDTIMDPTVLGLGRYIPRIQRVAEHTEITILVATGIYTMRDVPFQFRNRGPGLMIDEPEMMTGLFVKDIQEGIGDTGVRAAFLKCAIDEPGLTPGVERVMRAVGRASAETGAPITVHTDALSETGLVAQAVLASEGVDLRRVIIGHSGDTTDLDYLMKVADQGSYLGMDRFGLRLSVSFEDRVETVLALARRGYLDRIVVSHDFSCHIDWFSHPDDRRHIGEDWSFTFFSDRVVPALLAGGLSERDVDTILVDNPRRHFGA